MNEQELLSVVKKGESATIEFKSSFQKEVIATVVAFANAQGGSIIIGVSDDKTFHDVKVGEETIKDWLNQIKNNTSPSVLPDIEIMRVDNKTLVVISISEQPIKPIAFKYRYYKRRLCSNHLMSLDEIANEHLRTINSSWDYHIDTRHDFSDISMDKVLQLLNRIEKQQQKSFDEAPLRALHKYELIKEGKLTFAAYLLFVENVSAITSFQIGRFKSETDIIDSIDLNTDLLSQIETAIRFIRKNLMLSYSITGDAQREERYDYPLDAIREIVVNMVVHRDYRDSGNSMIKIFDDRIEFFNPGKLYGDLTIEKLQTGNYASRTRNRAIANIFKECGVIERYGSGIKRINKACLQYGLINPVFEEFQHGFKVTLFKAKVAQEGNGGVNGGVNGGTNGGVNELFNYIQNNPGLNSQNLAEIKKVSQRTIERYLKQLKDENKIEFIGANKTGGYYAK